MREQYNFNDSYNPNLKTENNMTTSVQMNDNEYGLMTDSKKSKSSSEQSIDMKPKKHQSHHAK